ncbi:D-alanyl-D-alanine carboxypeptidase [Halobacteroides halobius DSM 5150]|uniref:serine-type D-Ala-D-Ala carboxypeptidase n=1 Tax=Halobacteroides halobius (strain ATCC 35273 / DSM 5150 / MD-1) TaxID=748449 RepID=L0K869_HALHC|nr:D-alanyl-D-alanine carboxypeptidase family protein [Halobacteroides halobius]AGB40559.1 D-alanyl-D-alanine carboxypeptidase [Halobacteroides halobius DSM 5150]
MKNSRIIMIMGLVLIILFSSLMPSVAQKNSGFDLESKSAVLMDAQSGEIIYSKNANEKLPPASITKIMTMLLTMEALDEGEVSLTDEITASEHASKMGGSQIWLEPGEKMTLEQLLKAVAIVSANDACVAIAEHLYGTEEKFVEAMNKKAKELGMKNTYFYNTNGLPIEDSESKGNYTTAYDVALMSRALLQYPQVLKYTSTWIDHLRDGESFLRNTNNLVRFYNGADGLKTGYTSEAGFCLSATAQKEGMRFIAVVMKAPNSKVRFAEAKKLLSYAFSIHKSLLIAKKGEKIEQVNVFKGQKQNIAIEAKEDVNVIIKKGEGENLTKQIRVNKEIVAPIKKGDKVGEIVILQGDQVLERVDLVAQEGVEKANIFKITVQLLKRFIGTMF